VAKVIALPFGCTVAFPVQIDVDKLTDEMCEWFDLIGGVVSTKTWYDARGREKSAKMVQYGKAKACHRYQDGSTRVKLHFHGDDASTASVFIMKFFEHVVHTNLEEQMKRVARHG
jgi:hypothetical protein